MRPLHAVLLALTIAAPLACSATDESDGANAKKKTAKPASADDDDDDNGDDDDTTTTPAKAGLVTIDIGPVTVGEPATFVVPEHALGFVVVIEDAVAPKTDIGVQSLTSPSGVVAAKDNDPVGGADHDLVRDAKSASIAVPQGQVEPEAGTWTVVPNGTSENLHAYAYVQVTDDGAYHGGALDVVVHVPDGLKLDAETITAKTAAASVALTARIDAFYAGAKTLYGFDRGNVEFRPLATEHATVQSAAEANAASAAATDGDPTPQALHFVFTNDLFSGKALGAASGIPSAGTRLGTARSVVFVTDSHDGAATDASTMLHEGGHFFGLSHTTELSNAGVDPLDDTPECADTSSSDPAKLAVCPDAANLMFVIGPQGEPVLSEWQRRIVHGTPIYRAYANDAAKPKNATLQATPTFNAPHRRFALRCGRPR